MQFSTIRNKIFATLIAFSALCSAEPLILPFAHINTKMEITSSQITNDELFVSTANGFVLIYDLKHLDFSQKSLQSAKPKKIEIPPYKDFFGDLTKTKIYNTTTNDKGEILIVSANGNGTRDLSIFNGNLEVLLQNINIAKTLWLDDQRILIGLLSNEIMLYDLKSRTTIYRRQIATNTFSDMVLSNDKKILYACSEGGVKYAISTQNGEILHKYDHIHKDKIFQLALGGDVIAGAGQDRRLSVHNLRTSAMDFVHSDFLIYAVGISADGRKIAYMSDETGAISIIDSASLHRLATLKGVQGVPNGILFYKDFIISSADGANIYFFKLEGLYEHF